ncbi:pitrilysin family protein [Marinicella sp. S1101]|uniref:M16 family metallopeptidase n=1 Tax=Marinicella marina TaxID=2996016 RepID=UPI002260C436|nr:pitrilysin family protein [Marinicella marina]MCX7554430.1 pitrilysin family protein [Marinicella marina]MDJ1140581.1 pitrilysin family protein [Marinicella marina]
MKRTIVSMFAVAMLVACAPNKQLKQNESAAVDSVKSEDSRVFTQDYDMRELDNGLKVIVVKTDYPGVVSLQIPVQTGSRNEVEPGKSGFAHFFEHMMFRGTENFSQEQYGAMLKEVGADQNAYTTDDYTNYHVTFINEDLERMLMLEADRFQNLKYSEAQFRTEALAVKGEYLKNSANPFSKMFETVRKNAYSEHTYRHTTMGFIEDIEDMPNQLEYSYEFFDRWYRPEKAAVIVVGDVDVENTHALVEKYFGPWERGNYEVEIPVEPAAEGTQYHHIEWESQTLPMLGMVFRGPAADPNQIDKSALDMLGQIYFGQNSDVYQDLVVNRQLADALFFYSPDRKDPGLIYILARLTSADNYPAVKQAMLDTIVAARTETADEMQLNDIKSAARYSFANSLDNSEAIGDMLASVVQYNRDPEHINKQYAQLDAVTAADVKQIANKYLVDDGRTMVTLAQAEAVDGIDNDFLLAELVNAAKQPKEARYQITDMSNSSDIVDVNFLFNTGPAQDPIGKKGLAALTASMLTNGGSASKSIKEIQKAMLPMAAYFNSQVDKEMVSLSGRVHREKADVWLDLVLDSLLKPGFREDDFKRLKTQLINSIQTDLKQNNDEELGKEVLYQKLYPGHPYESLNSGHVSDLESITLDDVKMFYQQQLTQDNLNVGITGNLSAELKQMMLDRITTELNVKGTEKVAIDAAPEFTDRHVTIVEKQTMPTAVSFGFPIEVNRSHPDWVALWLVRSFLGEHRNSNSFLYQRIREARGMNYGDYAYIEYFPRGMFRTQPNANLGRSEQIFQVWLRPLRNNTDAHFATRTAMYELEKLIENGMSEEQFTATKAFLSKYAGLLLKGQDRVLGYQMDADFYGTTDFVTLVKEGLDKLTVDGVNQVIKKHLQTDDIQFVFITSDGTDMKNRLVNDTTSAMTYNSEKPAELLAEDEVIQDYPLKIESENVDIVPIDDVFK